MPPGCIADDLTGAADFTLAREGTPTVQRTGVPRPDLADAPAVAVEPRLPFEDGLTFDPLDEVDPCVPGTRSVGAPDPLLAARTLQR